MKFYNVSTKRTFKTANGEEKAKWLNVGTLRETDDGKRFLELNMFPDQSFYIFDQQERQPGNSDQAAKINEGADQEQSQQGHGEDWAPGEEVQVENIPF